MLERMYARMYIMTSSVAFVMFISNLFIKDNWALRQYIFWMAWSLLAIAQIIRFKHLKCPRCKKVTVNPQWSKSGTQECRNCQKVFEYDK